MTRLAGPIGVIFALLFVMVFARWNGGERVTVELGFYTLYRVPLTYVAFAGLFIGMAVMLLANLHSDLKVRRFLRERLEEEGRTERARIDHYQQDLFRSDPEHELDTPYIAPREAPRDLIHPQPPPD